MTVPESGSLFGLNFSKLPFTKEEVTEDKVRKSLNQLVEAKGKTQAARAKAGEIGIKWLEGKNAACTKLLCEYKEKKMIGKLIKDLKRTAYVSDQELKKATPERLTAYLIKINLMLSVIETFKTKEGKTLDPAIKADLKTGLDHLYEKKKQILRQEERHKGTYVGLTDLRAEKRLSEKNKAESKELEKKIIEKEQNVKIATNLVRTIENKIAKAKSLKDVEQLRKNLHQQFAIIDENLGKAGAETIELQKLRKKLAAQGFTMGTFRIFSKTDRGNIEGRLDLKREELINDKAIQEGLSKVTIKKVDLFIVFDEKMRKRIARAVMAACTAFESAGGTDIVKFTDKLSEILTEKVNEAVDSRKTMKEAIKKEKKMIYQKYIEEMIHELKR